MVTVIELRLDSENRETIRAQIISDCIMEMPGTSSPEGRTIYRYNVDQLQSSGDWIFFIRPASLNKGVDFKICCENFNRCKTKSGVKPPTHAAVLEEIRKIISISAPVKTEFLTALAQIWECKHSDLIVSSLVLLNKNLEAERALLLAKWMFIEQDVAYWNYSGRTRLRRAIEEFSGAWPLVHDGNPSQASGI